MNQATRTDQPKRMANTAVLKVDNLSCVRSGQTLLDRVSLEIGRKEFTGLIGPNGAGKSTLLKHIAGVLPVERGKIMFGDRDRSQMDPREAARHVAYVPQTREPDIPFTVREVIAQARYPYLSSWRKESDYDRRRVGEAMETVGVSDLSGRRFGTLSGGEQQKVMIASALAQDARLLLLDEPTTFLDPPFQDEIFRVLAELRRERHLAILVVTHDLNRVFVSADRVIAIRAGQIVIEGPPGELATEKALEEVFGARFQLTPHPDSGMPMVVPGEPARYEGEDA